MGRKQRQRDGAQVNGLPKWTPFERSALPKESIVDRLDRADALASELGVDTRTTLATLRSIEVEEAIWVNSRYQVNVRRIKAGFEGGPDMVHLSIKRRDKLPVGPERYRDFMAIKDELVGPECEAVELYPARSREVDTVTQYHLWAIDDTAFRFPFGFEEKRFVMNKVAQALSGARQNEFEQHHRR